MDRHYLLTIVDIDNEETTSRHITLFEVSFYTSHEVLLPLMEQNN